MKHAVPVTILGQQYTVRSEAAPDEVAKVVAFANEKISEVTVSGRIADPLNAAVLALLNLAGAYLRLQEENVASSERPTMDVEVESRLRSLLERLEQDSPVSPK